ncbi:Bifunctional protein FolD 1 [Ranunculus cassubicifolius]
MQRAGLAVSSLWRKLKTHPSCIFFSSSAAPPSPHSINSNITTAENFIRSPSILRLDLPELWAPIPHSKIPPKQLSYKEDKQNATIIDGVSIAEEIRSGISAEVNKMKNAIGKVPGLAVIVVGQRRDSEVYVRNKIKACQEVGIMSLTAELPEECVEAEILHTISSFNKNPSIHGILVQLPLPRHMDEEKILHMVNLEKDVDGFHPLNIGNLAMRGREPLFIPCTPKGCIELLLRSNVEIMGKNAVIIGRSNIVGLPTSLLLQRHHATVTTVHAFSKDPDVITREADIVVSAAGVANLVRGNWLKPGAVVIDVGTNPVEDPSNEHGYTLTGDVCFEEALKVVSAITPVPGGVGPMTVAMLLSNTLDSAKRAYNFT